MEQLYTNLGVSSTEIISTQANGFKSRMQFSRWLSMSCILFLVLIFGHNSFAQNVNNYTFLTGTNASLGLDKNNNPLDMSVGTTQVYGGNVDTYGTATLQNLGFQFTFMGVPYTQFSCNPDGQVRLGTNVFTGGHTSSAAAGLPLIIANNIDGKTDITGQVHYKVFGSAPNRVLVIEWKDVWIHWNSPTSTFSTYQLRLYEGTNEIEMVYGRMFNNNTSASTNTIGFSSSNTSGTVGVITNINTTPTFVGNVTSYTTTSFPLASDMVNLNSLSDGSRRFFRFSPDTVINGNVSNLTFTAIAANSLTLNWEDNASNESGFLIQRAIDPVFTQDLQTFNVNSTTSATTGTIYNLPQTGLTPGTTYYYRVYAVVEGGISPATSGNETTLTGATYYWVGADGGTWATLSNWNTLADGSGSAPVALANSDVYIIDGAGTTPGGALTIAVGANATIGQFKLVENTTLTLQSTATTTRTFTISGGPGDDFVIESGSTLNLTNINNRMAFVFSGTGNTGLIAGAYNVSGGTTTPNNFTTTGGIGTMVRVASTGVVTSNINGSTSGFVGSAATLIFENGSNWIHQNSTTVNYIPNATWEPNATATLLGNTTGTTLTSASTSLGNLIVNTTASTGTLSAFTSATRIIQGDLTINSTGTGRFRVVTTGLVQVNGNLNLNAGILDIASSTGAVIVKGDITIANGATLDVNQGVLQVEGNMVNNGSVLSSETTTSTSRINFVLSPNAQIFSGSGTFTGRVSGIGVSNPLGLTISTPVLTQRVNLFTGTITGSNNITIGTGAALAAIVQVGTANNTNPGGNFDVSPVFDLGTGTYSIFYLGETTPRTTGFEIPASRSITNLILDNENGLTITGDPIEVTGALTLTNGLINSSLASHIVHGTATTAGTVSGGSATSYINGPIIRTINDANANTNFNLFPVGKGGSYNPVWLAPSTTSASKFLVEAFDSNSGTADMSISNLSSTRRWNAIKTTGTFTDINVRVGDAALISENILAHASTANGVYNAPFGGVNTFVAGTPNTIQSQVAVNEGDYAGYLSFATSNACTGAPNPGDTVASSTTICLGESVALSLQNIVAGTGITYQWYSSPDGVTYAPINLATASTLNVTPTAATYYQCVVSCSNSSQSSTSTPVMVGFSNAILSTTPDTICGVGQATLAVTASAGSTVRWYDAPTAGNLLGSGLNFNTPTINTTTTFFAAAEGSNAGSVSLGTGLSTSALSGSSFFPGSWGGAKTQYIIRASELSAIGLTAGSITSLGFEPTTSGQTYQGFNVLLDHTTASVAPATNASFLPISGATTVYVGTLADDGFLPVANSVNTLDFGIGNGASPSFNWDGVSNIVVTISWSRVPAASTSTGTTMIVDNVGFVSSAARQRDNFTPAAMLAEATVGTTSSNRPRFFINGQLLCDSPRVPVVATVTTPPTFTISSNTQTICEGDTSAAITISAGANDYDTFVWSPSTGVSGDAINGWTFNPTTTTNYTLTVSQTTGDLCTITANVQVNVNPLPSALVITPSAPVTCENEIVSITVSGGQIGVEGKIGAQTSTNTSTTPFRGWWGGAKTQALYTPAELTALGVTPGESIKKIGYLALAGTPIPLNDFQVRVGLVPSSTSLGTTFISGANNLVFGPASYTPLATGNIEFPLSTPIVWDGTSSLLVETCFNNNNGGGVSANSISVESSTVTAGLMNSLQQDNNPTVCSNNTPSTSNLRPNLLISTKESFDFVWTPIANLYTDAAAQVPYIAGANASTVYFKGNANATYTVTVTPPSNCSVNGNVTITVNPTPSAPTAATQDFCANASPTVADLVATGDNLKWYDVATGGTPLLATSALTSGNYYVSQTLLGCESPRTTVQVNVNDCNIGWANLQWPASGTIGTCGNYTVYGQVYKLGVTEASGPNANITAWFGINSSNTDPSTWDASAWQIATYNVQAGNNDEYQYTFNNLPAGTYYIASRFQFTGGEFWYGGFNTGGGGAWDGTNNVSSVLTVLETIAPSASNQTFCGAATVASLVATGTALQWYDVATGGSPLAANAPIVTGTYYVSQTLNGCEGPRATVEVTINITPAPTASAQVFCSNSTVADLVATGADLQWYDVASGGVALASNTALVSGTYYVSQTLNNCESTRTSVVVTIDDCNIGWGNLQWPPSGTINTCGDYTVYGRVWKQGATEAPGPNANITAWFGISTTNTDPSTWPSSAWVLGTYNVQVGNDDEYQHTFSNLPSGTYYIASRYQFTGGDFWYGGFNSGGGGAWNGTSNVSSVLTVEEVPTPTGDALQSVTVPLAPDATLANLVVSGTNVTWYATLADAQAGTNALPLSTVLVSGNTYYAVSIVNGCRSAALAVTVTVNLDIRVFDFAQLRVYPNPVIDRLTITFDHQLERIEVYNMLGQMVRFQQPNFTETEVDMINLPAATYIVRIYSNDSVKEVKVIKK
ncbi:MAG: T9SS type A sorting domain-containing protein [Flavobacterium sp.]